MKILYSKTLDGICIQRCFGLDGTVQIPDSLAGEPVTRLAAYLFSGSMARALRDRGGFEEPLFLWDSGESPDFPGASRPVSREEADTELCDGLPAVCGGALRELCLPNGLKAVGAYAFHGCEDLKKLECASATTDWGAGAFTGCTGLERLSVSLLPGRKSCLKEILSELRQALRVDLCDPAGELTARLVFPEFYEESVENTPARIIMREVHGCGHMYRYCFDGGDFDFREYDRLFPYVQAQEPEEFVSGLALCRLCFPAGLGPEAQEEYRAYIREHPAAAARAAMAERDATMTARLAEEARERGQLLVMIGEAERAGNAAALALFMDRLHRRFKNERAVRRRFEL